MSHTETRDMETAIGGRHWALAMCRRDVPFRSAFAFGAIGNIAYAFCGVTLRLGALRKIYGAGRRGGTVLR